MMRRVQVIVWSLCVLLAGVSSSCSGQEGSPELWLSDFSTLKEEMAAGYANLEWAAQHNHIDIAALVRDTEAKLRKTKSAKKARRIITEFLEAFDDPHLRAKHTEPPSELTGLGAGWTGPANTASSKDALEAFGYRKGKFDFGVEFESLDGFRRLPDGGNPFPAGVLALDDGRKIGVIRIKYFGEDRYYNAAARTWEEYRSGIDSTCDQGCWWRFTLRVRTRLMEYLEARLNQLAKARVEAVAVDITGNGGGSEWCEDVAQLFTTDTLRPPPAGFVKHEHWSRQIETELKWIEEDLGRDDLTPEIRAMLEETQATHNRLLEEIRAGCDGSAVWRDEHPAECDRLAYDEHGRYVVPENDDGLAATLKSEHILFRRSRHPDFVAMYDGPLFVVIDGGTASASEQFATLLQYNRSATIVGERSYGAGCGYTRGGIKLYLENTGLRVWMPDCVRVRADGVNELSGIDPDVAGWDPGERGKDRARSLARVLQTM